MKRPLNSMTDSFHQWVSGLGRILGKSRPLGNIYKRKPSRYYFLMVFLRVFTFLYLLFFLANCASHKYADMRVFRAVGVNHKIFGLKNAGFVSSKDCAWKIFGYSVQAEPSFEDAFENAVGLKSSSFKESISEGFSNKTTLSKSKIKLLTNIQVRNEGWNALVLGKKCVKLRAIAYK